MSQDASDRDRPDDVDEAGTLEERDPGSPGERHGRRAPGPADGPADGDDAGTRERILAAAAEVFREKGFTGTRVVDIARRAGYTSGALYGYFENRAELLAEAIAGASSENLERLLGRLDDGDPAALLTAVLDQLGEPLSESDQMLLDGVALARREPVAGDRLAAALGGFRVQVDRSGTMPDGAAELLVVILLGVTAARALGLHDELPAELRDALSRSLACQPGGSLSGTTDA